MRCHFFFALFLVLCLVSGCFCGSETRYFRSDTQTVNGLTAYQLGTSQSTSGDVVSTSVASLSLDATLRPTSDVSAGFPYIVPPPPPLTTHYDKVDEAVADDWTSYVYTGDSTSYVYDRYGKTSYSLTAGKKIGLVRVTCRGYTDSITATKQAVFAFGVYIGSTYYLCLDQKSADAWGTKTYDFIRNPADDQAWTESDINGFNISLRAKSYSSAGTWLYAYITQVYVSVYVYTDATVYYALDVAKRDSGGSETAIGTKVAEWSGLISGIYDSYGLKSQTWDCPETALEATDSIVVRIWVKVGAGSYASVRNYTSEQLGATLLDAETWTVYYYLTIATLGGTSNVYTYFYHGSSTYNSRVEGFSWSVGGTALSWYGSSTLTFSVDSFKTVDFTRFGDAEETFSIGYSKQVSFSLFGSSDLAFSVDGVLSYLRSLWFYGEAPLIFNAGSQTLWTFTPYGATPFTFNVDSSRLWSFSLFGNVPLALSVAGSYFESFITSLFLYGGAVVNLFVEGLKQMQVSQFGNVPLQLSTASSRTWSFNLFPYVDYALTSNGGFFYFLSNMLNLYGVVDLIITVNSIVLGLAIINLVALAIALLALVFSVYPLVSGEEKALPAIALVTAVFGMAVAVLGTWYSLPIAALAFVLSCGALALKHREKA